MKWLVYAASLCSLFASLVYLASAMMLLFGPATHDLVLFIALVGVGLEVIWWTVQSLRFLCHGNSAKWHLNAVTQPLWDLALVLTIQIVLVLVFADNDKALSHYKALSTEERIIAAAALNALCVKIPCAAILQAYHKRVVRASLPEFEYYKSDIPLTILPTAPLHDGV